MDVIDFGAINAELDLAPDITSALPTEEDIISDLLADIEQQSVDELELDTIEAKGVTSEGQANFLIRRYKRLKDTAQKINDTADEELRKYTGKVNNWRDNELKSLSYQMDYIQAVLESYTKANITGKKKSIKMIEGTLAISKQQPKIEYNEEQLRNFLATIKDGENFLEPQEPKLLWGEFKKASNVGTDNLLHYGDKTVPGVVVTIRPDKFAIK